MPKLPLFAVKRKFIHHQNKDGSPKILPLEEILLSYLPAKNMKKVAQENIAYIEGTFYLLHDLARKGWLGHIPSMEVNEVTINLYPPQEPTSKDSIRQMMFPRRIELITESADWIKRTEPKMMKYFADGADIDPLNIRPEIEICSTQHQHDIFRYCRYMSSVPYSEYVGRRMHFLIRDGNLPNRPIIGISAIGSSLLQITSRDKWIGWEGKQMREIKKNRIGYIMDLYVCVSLPPYSDLLGGKLVCYMMVSNWVRSVFKEKYGSRPTLAKKRILGDLVMMVTTSIYGKHSSQYNRIAYDNKRLYIPVGETEGFGTLHIGADSFDAIKNVLAQNGSNLSNRFGDGANWRLRLIREGMTLLGFDPGDCLNHGHPRGVYTVPLAHNAREYLKGETDQIDYFDYSLDELIEHWRERWLKPRLQNHEVMERVRHFKADSLYISNLLNGVIET